MEKKIRNLWIQALKGSGPAYRKLGVLFLQGKECKRDKVLARLCLEKAIEMEDEQGYFLYHRVFSKGKKVIDDSSFEGIYEDYLNTKDWRVRRKLRAYLEVGAKRKRFLENKWLTEHLCRTLKLPSIVTFLFSAR